MQEYADALAASRLTRETPLQMTLDKESKGPKHMVAFWGGTDLNVGRQGVTYWSDGQTLFKTYLASLARFKGLADAAGVDMILTPSMTQQNGIFKLAEARGLEQDDSGKANALVARIEKGEIITHPFISKDDVERYFTIECECVGIRGATFTFGYELRDAEGVCTRGDTRHACVDRTRLRAVRVPEWLVQAVHETE